MAYGAVTLDTSIFSRNGYRLESGLLAQLSQFQDSLTKFVLSEIVLKELQSHLVREARQARERLAVAAKDSEAAGLLSEDAKSKLAKLRDGVPESATISSQRSRQFLQNTGAQIIKAHTVDVGTLLDRYFGERPPFSASEKKKNEFPDAIALLTLESWAKSQNKVVLAISTDKDWAAFAKESEWIEVEEDLAAALERVQVDDDHLAEAAIRDILKGTKTHRLDSLLKDIETTISDQLSFLSPSADGDSSFRYESEYVSLSFEGLELPDANDDYDYSIVRIGKNLIAVQLDADISAKAECEFSFYVHDSIDDDDVKLGSNTFEKVIEFQTPVLFTFEGDFSNLETVYATQVEMLDPIKRINFGNIGPDFGSDYEDE